MRSREEHRQPKISQESFRQRAAVKPQGYAEAPSSSPAQVAPSSREDQNVFFESPGRTNGIPSCSEQINFAFSSRKHPDMVIFQMLFAGR
ncbi:MULTISPECIES: hypothetical protein [Paenibacillus]|uniref:Uncharacterized protein n=1 Tax=Paenibacillus naphthalenovorans TaxID=162209 RepID=A0A0U2VWC9_9BACL|nr:MULTISPECIES: hypothetical protein [Paenibacillus]ALS20564.1 hypothetical protein IJ22_01720 [Paenibacillus naphthalenovorans]SDI66926.1 hypothetical protein SAMN05421868_10919 [Paenibacillus naphthalenovorans]